MKRIFKYELKPSDKQELLLPKGSEILSVEEQRDAIVVYALVDKESIMGDVYIIQIFGTGHPVEDIKNYKFLGTVKLQDGKYMFHVFYKKID